MIIAALIVWICRDTMDNRPPLTIIMTRPFFFWRQVKMVDNKTHRYNKTSTVLLHSTAHCVKSLSFSLLCSCIIIIIMIVLLTIIVVCYCWSSLRTCVYVLLLLLLTWENVFFIFLTVGWLSLLPLCAVFFFKYLNWIRSSVIQFFFVCFMNQFSLQSVPTTVMNTNNLKARSTMKWRVNKQLKSIV
jgi:hypothetical protein